LKVSDFRENVEGIQGAGGGCSNRGLKSLASMGRRASEKAPVFQGFDRFTDRQFFE
jgi:hypothetical protein